MKKVLTCKICGVVTDESRTAPFGFWLLNKGWGTLCMAHDRIEDMTPELAKEIAQLWEEFIAETATK